MIDVHAPHQSPLGVRDFFVHLLTITVGLLIALGLEAAVEAVHHRHQRIEAEATIRQELKENRASVELGQKNLEAEQNDMLTLLAYIDARLARQPADASKLHLGLSEGPLKDAAWRTAGATGIASYINYGTMEKFAECYKEQDLFEREEEHMLDDYLNIESFGALKKPGDLSDEDLRAAQPIVRKTFADIGALRDISRGALAMYDQALQ